MPVEECRYCCTSQCKMPPKSAGSNVRGGHVETYVIVKSYCTSSAKYNTLEYNTRSGPIRMPVESTGPHGTTSGSLFDLLYVRRLRPKPERTRPCPLVCTNRSIVRFTAVGTRGGISRSCIPHCWDKRHRIPACDSIAAQCGMDAWVQRRRPGGLRNAVRKRGGRYGRNNLFHRTVRPVRV